MTTRNRIRIALPLVVVVSVMSAGKIHAALIMSQTGSAPTTDVAILQTSNAHSTPWRTQSGLRQAGQTFLIDGGTYPGGFVLDAITVKIHSIQNADLDGDAFTLAINTYSNGTDFTPDSNVVTENGNLPASMFASWNGGSGNAFLTFDVPDLTLNPGQQYGFFLDPTGFSNTSNFLLKAQGNSGFSSGIGVSAGPAEMQIFDGVSQPADMEFYVQGVAAIPLITSTSSSAPTSDVAIQQGTSDRNAPWRHQQAPGTDNNPRDAGQTFLVGAGGLALDKITVRIDALTGAGFDGRGFTLALYDFTDASDVVPDPDKDSPIFIQSGLLPGTLKSDFDGGAEYLTIDLIDQFLSAGQYGFLLMHDTSSTVGDNLLLAVQSDENAYADGIAIRRLNRGTGSDAFSAQETFLGSLDTNNDLEFYLQAAPAVPEPSGIAIAALGSLALIGTWWRRRKWLMAYSD